MVILVCTTEPHSFLTNSSSVNSISLSRVAASFASQGGLFLILQDVHSESNPKPPPRRRKHHDGLNTPHSTPNLSAGCRGKANTRPTGDVDDEDDEFRPVDVDMNAVKNLLQSYEAQHGQPGPLTNVLGGIGVHLPTQTKH